MIAQSAHAATAVLHLNADHPDVKSYLKDWEGMRKAVLEVNACSEVDVLTGGYPDASINENRSD